MYCAKHQYEGLSECKECKIEELAKQLVKYREWIDDLQSGMYINCVYCGHRYPPGTRGVKQQVLYEHIKVCPEHPLSKAEEKIKQLEIELGEAQQWIDSEPDWKDQYMKRYMALEEENRRLKDIINKDKVETKSVHEDLKVFGNSALKSELLAYFQGRVCKCGNEKDPGFWECYSCYKKTDKWPEKDVVREACQKHISAAKAYMDVLFKSRPGCACEHPKTHNEDWPDGGGIIVCDDCGMSKYVWEQGESDWQMVDFKKRREELKRCLDALRKED